MTTTHDHGLGLGIPSPRRPGPKQRKRRSGLILFVLPTIILAIFCIVGSVLLLGDPTDAAPSPSAAPQSGPVAQPQTSVIPAEPGENVPTNAYTPPPGNSGPPGEAELTARLDAWWGSYLGLMGQGATGSLVHGSLTPPSLNDPTDKWVAWFNGVSASVSSLPAKDQRWPTYGEPVYMNGLVADPNGPLGFNSTSGEPCTAYLGNTNSANPLGAGDTVSGQPGDTVRYFKGTVITCGPNGKSEQELRVQFTFHVDPAFGQPKQGIPVAKVCSTNKGKC